MTTNTNSTEPRRWIATLRCDSRPGTEGGGLHLLIGEDDSGNKKVLSPATGKTYELHPGHPQDAHELVDNPATFPFNEWRAGAWANYHAAKEREETAAAAAWLRATAEAELLIHLPINVPPGVSIAEHKARNRAAGEMLASGELRLLRTLRGGSRWVALAAIPGLKPPAFPGESVWLYGSEKFQNTARRVLGWKEDGSPVVYLVTESPSEAAVEEVTCAWTRPLNTPRWEWLRGKEEEAARAAEIVAGEFTAEALTAVRERLAADGFVVASTDAEEAALAQLDRLGEVERLGKSYVKA